MQENIKNYERREEDREDRAEAFWNSAEQSANDFFDEKIREKYAFRADRIPKKEFEEEIKKLRDKAMDREKSFAEGLIKAVEEIKKSNPEKELFVLLDIDDTIAEATFDGEGKLIGNVVRPVLKPLLSYLQNEFSGIKYGFLTTRGTGSVREQLQDERYLGEIGSFIDPDLIYSTRDYKERLEKEADRIARAGTDEEFREIAKKIDRYDGNVGDLHNEQEELKKFLGTHPEVVPERIGDSRVMLNIGGFQKLDVVKSIREEHPHAEILVVDDFDYTVLLKNGFYVDKNSRFRL